MPLDAGQLLVLILQKNQETRNRQEVEMINILFFFKSLFAITRHTAKGGLCRLRTRNYLM